MVSTSVTILLVSYVMVIGSHSPISANSTDASTLSQLVSNKTEPITTSNTSNASIASNASNTCNTQANGQSGQASHDWDSVSRRSHQFHVSNGFILRTLSLILVISMALTMICTVRALFRRRSKWNKSKTRYDTLPSAAINQSLPKNAFVLNDSDDEETLFDASHRLIK